MKSVNILIAIFSVCLTLPARSAESVSPHEMVGMCNSLVAYVSIAVMSKESTVPLDTAVARTEVSINTKLTGVPPEIVDRYRAAVHELYRRIYQLTDLNVQTAHSEIIPACVVYSDGQYSERDVHQMKMCEAKVQPYVGFANIRDSGVPLEQQLQWLRDEGLKLAPNVPDRERVLAELGDMMRYVYAHPELSKQAIFLEQFTTCVQNSNV